MRQCVAYIHGPDTTLTFDLKVKFKGVLTCFLVGPVTLFCIDIGLPHMAHGSVSCLFMILIYNVDLKVEFIKVLTCVQI